MDWITQASAGAAVGEIMFGKRMGNRALGWGALFGIAPDLLDGLASPLLSTSGKLAYHYGPSHSLLLLVVLAFGLRRWLVKLWQRSKVTGHQAAWFVGLVWGIHLLVDCLGVHAVQVLWPYPVPPFGLNLLGQGDLLVAAPLLLALLGMALLRTKKEQAKRRRLWWWGVGLSSGYVVLAGLAKWAAAAGFEADLARRGVAYELRMESPIPWNLLLWRGMVDRGDAIWVGYRTVFEWHSTPVRWTVFPRNRAALAPYAATREARRVAAFTKGWWIARPNKTGVWLADLRSGEYRQWGERKGMVDNRIKRSWHLEPAVPGDPLRLLTPEQKDPGAMTRRLLQRTLGQRDAWEAQPRLAGVPGALPETLEVAE
ncbi:MAG: metal-dependent hydrolase [Verrucomicrobia bacterium]|nr:metal-dependent hydrolase [Verrucomicrobiota bacterium]